MTEDFQQTVDLREQAEKRRRSAHSSAQPLEEIYQAEAADKPGQDLKKISQPPKGQPRDGLIRTIVFILAILAVGATVYFLFFRNQSAVPETLERDWYAVKLIDGTVYYGQIFDLKANPLVIKNVYYNYDQAKPDGRALDQSKTMAETGNLRLVKRGKETQGGDGSIIVYPANGWPVVEPLRADSKVLRAILEYEK